MTPDSQLLRLPPFVRYRIYDFLGCARPCPVDLQIESTRLQWAWRGRDGQCLYELKRQGKKVPQREEGAYSLSSEGERCRDCSCDPLPVSLLRVCRLFYEEIIPQLYGRNKLQTLLHNGTTFGPLPSLAPSAIASLHSLLIRINCWPCPAGHNTALSRCRVCGTRAEEGDETLSKSQSVNVVRSWEAACAHLAVFLPPDQLRLTFICDTADLATAKEVTSPLRLLPTLKKCDIRLGRQPDYARRQLARQIVTKKTGGFAPRGAFDFNRLPQEIRLQILSFTHLCPGGNFSQGGQDIYFEKNTEASSNAPKVLQGGCCHRCNSSMNNCCCPVSYAAWSEDCVCRLHPFELFLVSRQMYQEARFVFFSKNCFKFCHGPYQALHVLTSISRTSLRLINRLQVYFSANMSTSTTEALWTAMLRFIGRHCDVVRLCIIIKVERSYGSQACD